MSMLFEKGNSQSKAAMRGYISDRGGSVVFKVLFWIHQVVVGLPSVIVGMSILGGSTTGLFPGMGLLLAWIGGTLVWGLAALIHREQAFDLPPVIAEISMNLAQLENMQAQASAVNAVSDVLNSR